MDVEEAEVQCEAGSCPSHLSFGQRGRFLLCPTLGRQVGGVLKSSVAGFGGRAFCRPSPPASSSVYGICDWISYHSQISKCVISRGVVDHELGWTFFSYKKGFDLNRSTIMCYQWNRIFAIVTRGLM